MWFVLNIAATCWFVYAWSGEWSQDTITAAFAIVFTALAGITCAVKK